MTSPRVNFAQLIWKTVGMLAVFILSLFLPTGTIAWPAGWLYVAVFFVFVLGLTSWLVRYDPALLTERLTGLGRSDQKKWDKVFSAIIAVGFFAWLAVMGLDVARLRWSHMPWWLQGIGLVVLLISFYVFYLTFRENTYLSPVVRIQRERGHKVVRTGLYRHIRHPMYAGFILYVLGTALTLGSWLGIALGLLLIAVVARRAVFEERTLQRELSGYDEYMAKVRYRLIPGVW